MDADLDYTIHTNGQLQPFLEREWLLTNGIGTYASSTIIGCNTRRYHGLLVAAINPPLGRFVTLSRLGEIIHRPNQPTLELSVNQFQGRFHPRGDQYLQTFEMTRDLVRFEYVADGTKVTKEVMLCWQRNAVGIRYTISPADFKPITFSVLPFCAMRDFHSMRYTQTARFDVKHSTQSTTIRERDLALHLRSETGRFVPKQDWWFGHFYAIDAERGQEFCEDLYSPGRFELEVTQPQTTFTLWASTEPGEHVEMMNFDTELERRRNVRRPSAKTSKSITRLGRAAEDFIVSRKKPDGSPGWTVLAGYPWFGDWGRDTMIALPGLFLSTGRFQEAGNVLSLFAQYVSEGMIPNRFDDYTNEPSYNTVDASLWFIHSVHEYARMSKDSETFESILKPACRAIIDGYTKGTRFNIHVDPADGLVTQGDATTQLTWMDAKMGDTVFTPRHGKAVEINALWYHALKLLGEEERAARVAKGFIEKFWINPSRGLVDVVQDNGERDTQMRPNQIFAVSLPNSPLSGEQQAAVVDVVRRELLTPMGLLTLDPASQGYCPLYRGDQFHRDRAYHNGTIWPWLIGAFVEAYLRVNQNSPTAREQARAWLFPLIDSMETTGCVGSLSEIYEAQFPHRPVGCFAQAWSIAEVLRLAMVLEM